MLIPGPGSITYWIPQLKAGDGTAAQVLWRRYSGGLVRLARKVLRSAPRGPADEEDIALTAFHCLCRRAATDKFAQLEDRRDLWRLLGNITAQKAIDQIRRECRQKRGGRQTSDAPVASLASSPAQDRLAAIEDPDPNPQDAAILAEQLERLLDLLGDDTLREIALLKMEGCANEVIAKRLNCGQRTVERKLALIRMRWQSHKPL